MRHSKRCLPNLKAPSRQRACRQCSNSKVRCDWQHPTCGRCQARSLACEFASQDCTATPPTVQGSRQILAPATSHSLGDGDALVDAREHQEPISPPSVYQGFSVGQDASNDVTSPAAIPEIIPQASRQSLPSMVQEINPKLAISASRRQALLGTAPETPSSDGVVRHTMHFVIRVLKSWPRLMAIHDTAHLPLMIHRFQLLGGIPTPLANCYALVKMWAGHTPGSRALVQNTILQEVHRLLHEVCDGPWQCISNCTN